MNKSGILKQLNPSQQEAVLHTEGPLLVLAGAGSGKTRVLTYRIAYIIENGLATPHQILAVTFTNKAANEMKQRVEYLLKMPVQQLWIGTFHSISARILHYEAKYAGYQPNFSIYDTDDQENLIKRIMEFLNINKEMITPRQVQYIISDAKNKLIDAKQFDKRASDFRSQKIAKIFWEYEIALRRNNALDFDDLIIQPIEIFSSHLDVLQKYQNRFKYILVDEYQDTNKAQYYWIKLLSKGHQNLCVVGDEDQSIYHWRGADISNILNFEQDYTNCKVVRLEQNYRSTQTILSAANALVSNNINRLGKNLWSNKGTGDLVQIYYTQDEIAESVAVTSIIRNESTTGGYSLNEIVILYRTNAQSRILEDQLRRNGIPYSIVGGIRFYERKEIKDILAYLKILVNRNDSVSLQRIINFPSRGIGPTTMKILSEYAFENKTSLYQAISNIDSLTNIQTGIAKRIKRFYEILETIRPSLDQLNAYQIVVRIIEEFKLKAIYEKSELVEDEIRLENINELLNSLEIFVSTNHANNSLEDYLDEVSLLTDIDRWDPDKPSVTLMTLHSAKGLEFPIVIVTGLEDGLLPLFRNLDSQDDLEEERRLFYVGMTRTMDKLYILNAQSRHRFGRDDFGMNYRSLPSRFLKEIPDELTQVHDFRDYRHYRSKQDFSNQVQFQLDTPIGHLPDEKSEFKIGQYVKHDVFGHGQIIGVEISSIGTKLTVQFERSSIKKLIAEYANLVISDDLENL
jgi:DNA helicase-2/ATP-dependent DNA helicase PcrA